jgi:TRAP-type C4-dicarboxylate transport system permease small subunit
MLRKLRAAIDAVGAALFTVLFVTFVVQVTARFAFDRPLPWTDELAVVLYVWVILWAVAVMVPAKEHVAFDLVYNAAGPRVRRGMQLVGAVLIGALAAYALPGSVDYVRFMGREGTPVLGVSFMIVFAPFVLLLAAIVVRSLIDVVAVLRGRRGERD